MRRVWTGDEPEPPSSPKANSPRDTFSGRASTPVYASTTIGMSEHSAEKPPVFADVGEAADAIVVWYRWTLSDCIAYQREYSHWNRLTSFSLTMTFIMFLLTLVMSPDGRGLGVIFTILFSLPLLIYGYRIHVVPRLQHRSHTKLGEQYNDAALLFSGSGIDSRFKNASTHFDWDYYKSVTETALFFYFVGPGNTVDFFIPKRAFEGIEQIQNFRLLLEAKGKLTN